MVEGAFKNVFGFIKFLGWVIGLLEPIPTWIVNLLMAVAVLLSVSPLLLSVQGVSELEPLFVPFAFFYLCVFIVRLLLWPKKMPNNPLSDASKSFQLSIKRILFYGIPVMIFFWLLVIFGLLDQLNDNFGKWSQYLAENTNGYYNILLNLPSLSIPNTDVVIPGSVVLVGGILALILLIRRFLRR